MPYANKTGRIEWGEEALWKLHHYRRKGMYPEDIAPLLNKTLSAVTTKLSREKTQKGIIHKPLKPKSVKFDKEVVAKWRSMKQKNPKITYKKMAKTEGAHYSTICKKLVKELYGELEY